MRAVNVHEAKTQLSALLVAIEERGEVFVICRAGKPIAELRAVSRPHRDLSPDPRLRQMELLADPTEPLDPESWGDLA